MYEERMRTSQRNLADEIQRVIADIFEKQNELVMKDFNEKEKLVENMQEILERTLDGV